MSQNEIDEIVKRANFSLKNQQSGFDYCSVISYTPAIIEYNFRDHISANAFWLNRKTLGRDVRMGNSDLSVLEELK